MAGVIVVLGTRAHHFLTVLGSLVEFLAERTFNAGIIYHADVQTGWAFLAAVIIDIVCESLRAVDYLALLSSLAIQLAFGAFLALIGGEVI